MSFTAKSVILDIADNWGGDTAGIRSVDFWSGGAKISLAASDFDAYATTYHINDYGDDSPPECAFDTSLSKTGTPGGEGWSADSFEDTNQRLIVVFNSSQTFDEIKINNYHFEGNYTDNGAKNVVIHTSSDAITDTTYDASIPNSTLIFDAQFDEHVSSDTEDEQVLSLSEILPEPAVITEASTDVTRTTAVLNGTLDEMGEESSVDVYFEWGTDTSYGNTTTAQTLSATGPFSDSISGLTVYQTYHSRAVVTDGSNTWYGSDTSFTAAPPTVTTDSATDFASSPVTVNGTLDTLSGEASVDVYFEWGTDTSYGNTTSQQTLSSTGSFSDTISGLSDGTLYHYRAAVTDGVDTWYGSDVSFAVSAAFGLSFDGDCTDINGTYNGTGTDVTFSTGKLGQAAEFNGSSSKVDLGQIPDIEGISVFSITFWMYAHSYDSGDTIFRYGDSDNYIKVDCSSTGYVTLGISSSATGQNSEYCSPALSVNTWHFFQLVYDNGDFSVYIDDGSPRTQSNGTAFVTAAGGSGRIGAHLDDTYYFDGMLDQFFFWHKALTASDRDNLYYSALELSGDLDAVAPLMDLNINVGGLLADLDASMPAFEYIMENSHIEAEFPFFTLSAETIYMATLNNTLPSFSMDAEASLSLNWDSLRAYLPELSLQSDCGGHGSASLPSFSMSAETLLSVPGSLSGRFPALFSEMKSGATIAEALPRPGLVFHSLSDAPGSFQGAFPKITISAGGVNRHPASIVSRVPVFQLSVHGDAGNVAVISEDLPRIEFAIEAMSGTVAEMLGALPGIDLDVSSIVTGENDMEAVIAVFTFLAQSGELDSDVLRYVKGKVR